MSDVLMLGLVTGLKVATVIFFTVWGITEVIHVFKIQIK